MNDSQKMAELSSSENGIDAIATCNYHLACAISLRGMVMNQRAAVGRTTKIGGAGPRRAVVSPFDRTTVLYLAGICRYPLPNVQLSQNRKCCIFVLIHR